MSVTVSLTIHRMINFLLPSIRRFILLGGAGTTIHGDF